MKNEWKRHRGSKAMPKCLEGKKFEVRFRNGRIMEGHSSLDWRHFNNRHDVMAFRIMESEPAKPDYSNGFPEGTTAKDIGAKVGDEFVVVSNDFLFKDGEVIYLYEDDESTSPLFENERGVQHYMYWHELAPAPQKTAIELQAEEVGIAEPVQYVADVERVQPNKYQRTIKGVTVDIYDVLDAFGVTCQARGHAIKKLLMAGQRGHKDEAQDLREAVQAIERSIELVKSK